MLSGLFVVLFTLIQYQLCFSSILKEECCKKFPKAMDINTFQTRVANGEDWATLFGFTCPLNVQMTATEQFRISMNVTNGVLSRKTNFRPKSVEPCVGVTNVTFDQVGSGKAVFRQEGAGKVSGEFDRSEQVVSAGLIREDRYLDTGSLDDYYILFLCFDRASARRGRCFNYGFAIGIREDPPRNFPWHKVIHDLKRCGIDARDLSIVYVGEICPVT